ncbi:MAG TPA: SDR family NAD(P)-dependent oxidoreductase [Acidimicrobiales bacterium]|nr:SDR family NAD(P)-dependent oxidoreductase [Acidimicrobiales bacterium]
MPEPELSFAERYGPWAVIAGASEGVGEALARAVAARGVHVVLLARRQTVLDGLAASLRAEAGVEARAVAVDLAADGAADAVAEATRGLEVGLLAYCAGADPAYAPFLDQPIDAALGMIHRNCSVPAQLCHHYGGAMATRGRGGIVLVGSGAGLVGAPNMVAYGATKAFGMVLAEALWAELHERGVDVLGLILAVTDTPALRRLLARRGVLAGEDDPSPIPGAATAEEVAAEALAHLAAGPTRFVGELLRDGAQQLGALPRNDAVRLMIDMGGGLMGQGTEGAA